MKMSKVISISKRVFTTFFAVVFDQRHNISNNKQSPNTLFVWLIEWIYFFRWYYLCRIGLVNEQSQKVYFLPYWVFVDAEWTGGCSCAIWDMNHRGEVASWMVLLHVLSLKVSDKGLTGSLTSDKLFIGFLEIW